MFKAIIEFILSLLKREPIGEPGKGLLKSPQDYRDIPMSSVYKKFTDLPQNYRIPYELKIKNQGSTPQCVGYSCATMKEEKERREQNFLEFEPAWIYRECKKIDGIPEVQGTYFRAGLKVLQKTGAKPEGNGDFSDYRIGAYVKIKPNFESIKQAIYEYGVVLGGFEGSNEGWAQANIRAPYRSEHVWGHAVAIVGWTANKLIIHNSWGKGKGDKGYFYTTKDYLPFEVWAILSDLPSNWKELLTSIENKPKHIFEKDLWYNVKDPEVKILQDALKYFGCMDPSIESVESFGPKTREAIMLFQERYGIRPVAGYFGKITRAKINELLK